MKSNPFFHRGPIRDRAYFFGREREIGQILSLLGNEQSISLVGQRRIGKTSLLFHIADAKVFTRHSLDPSVHIFAYISCGGMGGLDQPGLYRLILEEIHEALTERGVNPSWLEGLDSARPMTYRAFERALRRLTRGGWKPILILDEFDLMAQNLHLDPDFFSGLRAVAARYPIAYVTASKRPLLELTYANASALSSPFFNFFASIRLGLFPGDESRDMLARLAARAQMIFEPSTINFCLDLAGPHPFFLQIAGFHAFELQEARGGPLAAGDHARLRRRFDVSVEEHYGYFWRNLSATQQRVMATLPASQDRHRDIMRQLEGECLIRRRAEGYDYLSSSLRAFAQSQPVPGLLQAGPIAIDESQRQTLLHGQPLSLSPTQYSLLQHFVEKRGQVIAAEDLERAVWGEAYIEDPERLKSVIKGLRKALGDEAARLENVRGVGYLLRG